MRVFPTLPELGDLRVAENDIYWYYDGPRLFAATNEREDWFLVVWYDEDDVDDPGPFTEWVCVRVSTERLEAIRTGRLEIRRVFTECEYGGVYLIHEAPLGSTVRELSIGELDVDALPAAGEFVTTA